MVGQAKRIYTDQMFHGSATSFQRALLGKNTGLISVRS